MDTRQVVDLYVKVFKIHGLLPPKDNPISYNIWAIIVALFLFIFHTLFKISSLIFVNSVDDIIRVLLIANAIVTISLKSFFVRVRRNVFANLLDCMHEMDKKIKFTEYQRFLEPLIDKSRLVYKSFSTYTFFCWISIIVQLMITPPEAKLYISTYYYPYESARKPLIYIGGLVYETVANGLMIPIFIALNFYGIMLLCILAGYINILCERLRAFGNDDSKGKKLELVEICEMYIGISK